MAKGNKRTHGQAKCPHCQELQSKHNFVRHAERCQRKKLKHQQAPFGNKSSRKPQAGKRASVLRPPKQHAKTEDITTIEKYAAELRKLFTANGQQLQAANAKAAASSKVAAAAAKKAEAARKAAEKAQHYCLMLAQELGETDTRVGSLKQEVRKLAGELARLKGVPTNAAEERALKESNYSKTKQY